MVMMIGTDSGIPMKFHSQSTWNELEVWVNVMDVDPLDAIKSATYWPSFLWEYLKKLVQFQLASRQIQLQLKKTY